MNQHLKIYSNATLVIPEGNYHEWVCGICGQEGQDPHEVFERTMSSTLSNFRRVQGHFGRGPPWLAELDHHCSTRYHGRCLTCRHWGGAVVEQLEKLAVCGDVSMDPEKGVSWTGTCFGPSGMSEIPGVSVEVEGNYESLTITVDANHGCPKYRSVDRETFDVSKRYSKSVDWCPTCCMPVVAEPCPLCHITKETP